MYNYARKCIQNGKLDEAKKYLLIVIKSNIQLKKRAQIDYALIIRNDGKLDESDKYIKSAANDLDIIGLLLEKHLIKNEI